MFAAQVPPPAPAFRNWLCLESQCSGNLILLKVVLTLPGLEEAQVLLWRPPQCRVPSFSGWAALPIRDMSIGFTGGQVCRGKLPCAVAGATP